MSIEEDYKHGEWVCPKYGNRSALPDQNNNCSLCGAKLIPGYPEVEAQD